MKKKNIKLILKNTLKKYASQYYQLNIRYGAIKIYLVKIRIIKHPNIYIAENQYKQSNIYIPNTRVGKKNVKNLLGNQKMLSHIAGLGPG